MSNWIGTNGGRSIDLDAPDPDQIDIHDIATGLSHVCRFGGQVRDWYSVAEHSLNVADICPPHLRLIGLLHDATEAYICDIPSPLKRQLGQAYADIETRLAFAIGERFGLGTQLVELPTQVKLADRMVLMSERDELQTTPQQWGPEYEESMRYPQFRRRFTKPEDAREKFLAMFWELTGEKRHGR